MNEFGDPIVQPAVPDGPGGAEPFVVAAAAVVAYVVAAVGGIAGWSYVVGINLGAAVNALLVVNATVFVNTNAAS